MDAGGLEADSALDATGEESPDAHQVPVAQTGDGKARRTEGRKADPRRSPKISRRAGEAQSGPKSAQARNPRHASHPACLGWQNTTTSIQGMVARRSFQQKEFFPEEVRRRVTRKSGRVSNFMLGKPKRGFSTWLEVRRGGSIFFKPKIVIVDAPGPPFPSAIFNAVCSQCNNRFPFARLTASENSGCPFIHVPIVAAISSEWRT
jgi:hypothetical protein